MLANHNGRPRPARLAALIFASALVLVLLISCGSRPTVTPVPTLDVVGTVTALARPVAATQAALVAASTQAAVVQATTAAQVAQTATQAAGATQAAQLQKAAAATAAAGTTVAQATSAAAAATTQAGSATQTAQVQAAAAQAATATALASSLAAEASTATAIAAANATAFNRATALAAVTPTPTPVPATATPTATPTPPVSCIPANNAFAAIIGKAATAGLDIGCTTGAAFSTEQGALQEYWANPANPDPGTHLRSLIVWRGDTREIYVIKGQDTQAGQGSVLRFIDTFQDGSPDVPPACAALKPPAGYQMPVRGFGKVWCDNKLEPAIGWPNRGEVTASLQMQTTARGLLMKVSAPSAGLGYLVALDLRSQRAVTAQIAP